MDETIPQSYTAGKLMCKRMRHSPSSAQPHAAWQQTRQVRARPVRSSITRSPRAHLADRGLRPLQPSAAIYPLAVPSVIGNVTICYDTM